jgi:signal transduction histidine kinase
VGQTLLRELAPLVSAHQGVVYQVKQEVDEPALVLLATYADGVGQSHPRRMQLGEGLIGQCARDGRQILISDMPENVVPIGSGTFSALPRSAIVLPILFEGQVKAVVELTSVANFTELQLSFLEQLTSSMGILLNSIEATMQTEALLQQSQQLAAELQTQQSELQQTNEQLEQKAQQLEERNVEVEAKNQEIEQARRALEEKATELALTSKYKSEFLANMSHELRTPLNSILILGQQLGENPDGNLSSKQVEFAKDDPWCGHRPSQSYQRYPGPVEDRVRNGLCRSRRDRPCNLLEVMARPFRHEAESRALTFAVDLDDSLPRTLITDAKRLQQILKNLLSNAFKFTSRAVSS